MKRILKLVDFEDGALLLGLSLLCGGLALMHVPSAMMLAGGLILVPVYRKYLPGRKER